MIAAERSLYNMVVIGASQGGYNALKKVLSPLPKNMELPILVVRHQAADSNNYLITGLRDSCSLHVKYAEMNEKPLAGRVYIAPPNHHLIIGEQGKIQLTQSKPINFSRPSIDSLFISAAKYYRSGLIAVVLTGANNDGAKGLKEVMNHAGTALIQDPDDCEAKVMPLAAIEVNPQASNILPLDQIGPHIWGLTRK